MLTTVISPSYASYTKNFLFLYTLVAYLLDRLGKNHYYLSCKDEDAQMCGTVEEL